MSNILQQNYFLHHQETLQTHEYLTLDGLINTIRSDQNLRNWLIWNEGKQAWMILAEDQDLIQKIQNHQSKTSAPTKPPKIPSSIPTELMTKTTPTSIQEGEFEIVDFVTESVPPVKLEALPPKTSEPIVTSDELRKYPRIRCKLRTIITDQNQAFLTYTENVSLGGFKLQHAIPLEIIRNKIEVYITAPSKRESIVFRCRAFKDPAGFYRFEFTDELSDSKIHLASWLDSLR